MTARSNRQKADQDPRDWMPPLPSAHCRYISEWVGTKLSWNPAADNAEMDALAAFAHGDCAKTAVVFTPAPQHPVDLQALTRYPLPQAPRFCPPFFGGSGPGRAQENCVPAPSCGDTQGGTPTTSRLTHSRSP